MRFLAPVLSGPPPARSRAIVAIVVLLMVLSGLAQGTANKQAKAPNPLLQNHQWSNADYSSHQWSGYLVEGPQPMTGVSDIMAPYSAAGTLTVPTVFANPNLNTFTALSMWIGIGGWHSPAGAALPQAGVRAVSQADGTTSYVVWTEDYPHPEVNTGLSVQAGDKLYISVQYSPVNGDVSFLIAKNGATANPLTGVRGVPDIYSANEQYAGTVPPAPTAEWIVERPEVTNSSSTKDHYPLAQFTGANFSNIGYEPLNGTAPKSLSMTGCDGATLAEPTALTGPFDTSLGGPFMPSFDVQWDDYGSLEPASC